MDIEHGYCHCGCGAKTNVARDTNARYGHVRGEPFRFLAGHSRGERRPIEDRFWEKVSRHGATDCWEWTAAQTSTGYGKMSRGASGRGNIRAHRFSWEIHFGPVPKGQLVCHICDNRLCVNPSHLFLGSYKDNFHDAYEKGRTIRGETTVGAKLTEKDVAEIRDRHEHGETQRSIAQEMGICPPHVSNIVRRKSWRHVK